MESECFQAYKSLVREITKGMEQVKQLRASSSSNQDSLLERMLVSYEEALLILNGSAPEGECESVISSVSDPPHSSASICKVTQSKASSRDSRKRKLFSSFAEQVTVTSHNLLDDGYVWRKYGQKIILNSNYPRNYYRCTHRYDQGCKASKQVQQSQDDTFLVTYYGKHTCSSTGPVDPQLASLGKQE